jgi:hypothetical protein
MKYSTAGAFRMALEQRLQAIAKEKQIPLVRLRKLVVFDRLMARLLVVAPSRWILKGAVALNYRTGAQFRTTKDLDIGRQDSEEAATEDFLAVQSIDLGDYFTFVIELSRELNPNEEDAAVRYHVTAMIAGRPFDDVTVDVGFGDLIDEHPDMLLGPDLLGFADINHSEVPALPLEQHIAEKVHAYTRKYGEENQSSRVKDLIDLVMISSLFGFKAGRLRKALSTTFNMRATHESPVALPPPPALWDIPYRKMADEVGLDQQIDDGYKQVRLLLDPILSGTVSDDAKWDLSSRAWY